MNQDFLSSTRKKLYQMFYLQIVLVIILTVFFLFYQGLTSALSVFLGSIAWIIPSFYFSRKCFIIRTNSSPNKLVRRIFITELLKLIVSSVLLVTFVKFININLLPFLLGFIIAVLTIWFMPYVFRR